MVGQKYIPQFINVDVHPSLVPSNCATFIKNLAYSIEDTSGAGNSKDARTGVFKPLQSTSLYVKDLVLPAGYNQTIGALSIDELRQVFAFVYNDKGNHTIYRLNGSNSTYDIVRQTPDLNFQLDPKYFVANEGGAYLEIVTITDPDTGIQKQRTFLMYTDGYNSQRFLCVEDSIATNGYDANKFPFFKGDYDRNVFINMGVATPKDCITINEVSRTVADAGFNNTLLFNTWQFRLLDVDVWGRPSEHGIISDMYIPGINDCIGASSGLPRCLDLVFPAPNPTIDKIQIEYRNCIDQTWYLSDTIYLYNGSPLGQWWTRGRNKTVAYDQASGNITYTFCADHECQPLPTNETSRVQNPLPRTSQSIAKIGDFIGLGNNKDGFAPFSQDLLDGINITVESPTNIAVTTASITIYIPIWNQGYGNYQAVMKNGATNFIWGDNNSAHGGALRYQQYFINPLQSGFGGYLVGTGNYAIATQWYVDASGVLQPDVDLVGLPISLPRRLIYQKFVFTNIPRGNYVFRLFSHQTDPSTNASYSTTSTTVWGLCSFNPSNFTIDIGHRRPSQELLINTCNGDYDTMKDNKILVIADLAYGAPEPGFQHREIYETNKATIGYWFETNKNGFSQYPMELIKVSVQYGYCSLITDHNGFYWYATRGNGRTTVFTFMYKCNQVAFSQGQGGDGLRILGDLVIDQIRNGNNLPYSDYSSTDGSTGNSCNRILIKGKVILTGTNIPVSNVTVVLTRGQFATTDANGNYTIVAHDDNITGGTRNDFLVLASGTCAYTDKDGNCIPVKAVAITRCNSCVIRIVNETDFVLNFLSGKGLLSGGTYGASVIGHDFLGRETFAEPLKYFSIPTITEVKSIGPSKVRVTIDPSSIFPPETTYITIALTKETTIDAYIDWIVDKVDFVDNTGQINLIAPTQIKIYYASLLEYNKQNNFNTTTNWNFLESLPGVTNQTPFTHDIVYFYLNGDGTYFSTLTSALIKYDQTGQYFLIDYTDALKGLLPNALMRLVRPKVCTGTEGYFELCPVITVTNGIPQSYTFYIDAFDTYYLFRQIPVPVFVNPTKTTIIAQTVKQITNPDKSITTITQTTDDTITQINEPRTFGFPFEHNSPSNFWGSGCYNQGRPFVKNPFEAVLYHIDQIALSGALSDNGVLNYLNYFDDSKKINFNASKINGIVAILPETATILVIGQNDYFIVGFSDNLARAQADGTISTGGNNNAFGQPQSKIGSNYGCNLIDKNTIYKHKGLVHYLDSNESAIIQNNYSEGIPFTETGADSYIKTKIKEVQSYNNSGKGVRYFVGVVNTSTNEYVLTDKIIRNPSFLNTLRVFDVTQQETVSFGMFSKLFRATYGFTPEYYSSLEGDVKDRQLFSFTNGLPNSHYDVSGTDYGSIYGTVVNRVIKIVSAIDNLKKKRSLSIGIYCKQGTYFSDVVTTETGQVSRILLSQFLESQFGFYAPFLCDVNTPQEEDGSKINAIMDGDILVGTWAEINLVGDPSVDNEYTELEGIVINVIPSEYSGV